MTSVFCYCIRNRCGAFASGLAWVQLAALSHLDRQAFAVGNLYRGLSGGGAVVAAAFRALFRIVYFIFFSRDISFLPFAVVVVAEALFWRSTEMIIIVNNGLRRFGISALLVIFGTTTRAIAAVLFMFLAAHHDVAHWAWWYLAANAVALLFALRFYPKVKLRFEPRLYLRRVSDSIAVMGAELLFYIQSELDKLLVLSIGGPTTAGIYAIIMRLVDLTALPIRSFNMMLVQKLMRNPNMLASLRIRAGLEFAVLPCRLLALARW